MRVDGNSGSANRRGKVVVISDHDYRTARRASVHQIADAFARLGHKVSFISVRFSVLSRIKGDSRNFLWRRANKPEVKNNIQCYLWKTPFHPFKSKVAWLDSLSPPLYRAYGRMRSRFIDDELRSASFIMVESGLGAVLLNRARALNETAKIIYLASDDLMTVGVHPYVQTRLEKAGRVIDQACVTSRKMADGFRWIEDRLFFVPHGIREDDFTMSCDNPFRSGIHSVSAGSMLFDAGFFADAAAQFPDVMFHVIGAGRTFDAPGNVTQYPEMAFRDTMPFIIHATIGLAPYRAAPGCEYLSDTSIKLQQYEYCGVPAVCPTFAVGDSPNRFGYVPGDAGSIAAAIESALANRRAIQPPQFLTWEDVAHRMLEPRAFADTAM
jgi:2-beta-glucuronyltransferase